MSLGLLGKKVGMTRIFDEDGNAIAVTVVDVSDNVFIQKKTKESDGYSAIQVGYDDRLTEKQEKKLEKKGSKVTRLNKPERHHFEEHKAKPKKLVREFRVESDEELPEGDHPGMELYEEGQWVDVIGQSKGKGFQAVYKRYGFGGLPSSHGSMMHRRPGGIGAGTDPGRVWKNKEMPGRHGNYRKTIQNLKVVKLRPDDNVILISGAIPGAKGSYVTIRPAKKKPLPAEAKAQEEAKKKNEKKKK